jgi:acetyl esterase/lipase
MNHCVYRSLTAIVGLLILSACQLVSGPEDGPTATATSRPQTLPSHTPSSSLLPTPTPRSTATPTPTASRTASPTSAPTDGAYQVDVMKDIPYGEHGVQNLLDLYLPVLPGTAADEIPVVVLIHGGGMVTGSKEMTKPKALLLSRHGYAVASINYRLAPDYYLPTQIYDAKAAVRWLRAHAGEYGLDMDNIGAIGGSAGAMIAAVLGTSGDVAELEGDVGDHLEYSSRVQAVVPIAGVYDLFSFYQSKIRYFEATGNLDDPDKVYLQWFVGCSLVYETCWEALELGSATTHVSADDPPFLIIIGDQDETPRGIEDHTAFHQALQHAGVDSTLIIVPGARHGEGFDRETDAILGFLNRHLKQ